MPQNDWLKQTLAKREAAKQQQKADSLRWSKERLAKTLDHLGVPFHENAFYLADDKRPAWRFEYREKDMPTLLFEGGHGYACLVKNPGGTEELYRIRDNTDLALGLDWLEETRATPQLDPRRSPETEPSEEGPFMACSVAKLNELAQGGREFKVLGCSFDMDGNEDILIRLGPPAPSFSKITNEEYKAIVTGDWPVENNSND